MQRGFNEEVIVVSERDRGVAGIFSRSGDRRGLRSRFSESQDTLRTRPKQVTTKLVEISQGKHDLARARFLVSPRYLTLVKPHNCLSTRKGCSPQARSANGPG